MPKRAGHLRPEWKEHPCVARASQDKVSVAHRGFAEYYARRCYRPRNTGRDLLNVTSGFAISR